MDSDLALILGIILGVLSIPSIIAAFSEGHAPRVAALVIIVAGILVVYAIQGNPGGYSIIEIPDVFVRVVARFIS